MVQSLRKVLAVNAKMNSTLDLDELLGIIMTTASEVMQSDVASLMLIDDATQELVFKVALGDKGADLVEKFRLKMGEGIGGHVAKKFHVFFKATRNSDVRHGSKVIGNQS